MDYDIIFTDILNSGTIFTFCPMLDMDLTSLQWHLLVFFSLFFKEIIYLYIHSPNLAAHGATKQRVLGSNPASGWVTGARVVRLFQ